MIIKCPNCSQEYDVGPEDVGKTATCSKCGRDFVIKAATHGVIIKHASPHHAPAPAAAAPQNPPPAAPQTPPPAAIPSLPSMGDSNDAITGAAVLLLVNGAILQVVFSLILTHGIAREWGTRPIELQLLEGALAGTSCYTADFIFGIVLVCRGRMVTGVRYILLSAVVVPGVLTFVLGLILG